MKQTKAIITTLLLFLANCAALPVTSKALENNSDQLIWQTAWYSDARASPFTGDSKKISPKSIFITPNLDQSPVSCPPGFKIDDNGKCIKIVSINQDDLLVTRLQSFFSQHQTTDDSTSIDYDYSVDEEATHYDLPLIPIFNGTRGDQELGESFRDRNDTQASGADVVATTTNLPVNYLINGTENHSTVDENSNKTRVNESGINSDRNDTTTVADTTLVFTDQFEDESNYTTTTLNELVIKDSENPQPDVTISGGDYFDAMMQNDSLLIDDTFSESTTGVEFDMTTLGNFDEESSGEKGSGEVDNEEKTLANKVEPTSENPQDIDELSSSEKASTELLSTEKASSKLPITDKFLSEKLNSEKASLKLPSSEKASTELLSSEKASESQINSQKLSSSQKAPLETLNLQINSQKFSKLQESSQKLSYTQNELRDPIDSQKAPLKKPLEIFDFSTEAPQLSSKAPIDFLSKIPALLFSKAQEELLNFPKFVTVEKTSSKPSIVNGPFLIFGTPFTRPSSLENGKIKEKVKQENSLSSSNPTNVENFEYSTFDTIDGSFSPSTDESLKNSFEVTTTETENKTETSTTTPTTTQNFEFTPSFPYENRIIKDDQQNSELENVEEANKFVYHHLPSADASTTTPSVRFPSQQRVRFPDEPSRSSSFSWPRDNGLMRFWQEQPLINDFKIFSRGHSNFRRPSYRRIQ